MILYDALTGALDDTQQLKLACDALSKRLDREYNRRLARAVRRTTHWKVWENLGTVGGERVGSRARPLGDLDILAIHKSRPSQSHPTLSASILALGPTRSGARTRNSRALRDTSSAMLRALTGCALM